MDRGGIRTLSSTRKGTEHLQIHWASTPAWRWAKLTTPQATHWYQLSSAQAFLSPGPPASYTVLTLKPESRAGGETFGQTACILASWISRKEMHQSSASQSRSAIFPNTEVDIGACESSPADGALFALLSPQTRGRPERGFFPEGLDFPTGTKWGLLAGHESWRRAARARLSTARRQLSDIRQIPPSPQLGLTAGSPREAPNKG